MIHGDQTRKAQMKGIFLMHLILSGNSYNVSLVVARFGSILPNENRR